jgi:RNA polymerase sigma-70 factor, ECF subfamily
MANRSAAEQPGDVLLHRIARGDRGAMEELYDQYSALLFSIAVKVLRDTGEAEEVLQEVFVQVWQRPDRFNQQLGSATSWLACVTRNRAIDRIRARQNRQRLTETLQGEEQASPAFFAENADLALDPDAAVAVRKALQDLPVEQSQAIELTFFSGLTHQETADALGQPLGTIKARIRRGMLKLRDSLQPYL